MNIYFSAFQTLKHNRRPKRSNSPILSLKEKYFDLDLSRGSIGNNSLLSQDKSNVCVHITLSKPYLLHYTEFVVIIVRVRGGIQNNYRFWEWKNRNQRACLGCCNWWHSNKERVSSSLWPHHSKCKVNKSESCQVSSYSHLAWPTSSSPQLVAPFQALLPPYYHFLSTPSLSHLPTKVI